MSTVEENMRLMQTILRHVLPDAAEWPDVRTPCAIGTVFVGNYIPNKWTRRMPV